jgi:hypothetical protein
MIDEEIGLVIERLQEQIRLAYLVIMLLLGAQIFNIPQSFPNDSLIYLIGKPLFFIILIILTLLLILDNYNLNKRVKSYLFSIKKEE